MKKGCSVFVLTDARAHTIPAKRFLGALNLDSAAQTCSVMFYASPSPGTQQIATANALASAGVSQGIAWLPRTGIALAEGALSFQASAAPTGAGIAVYYDVE